MNKLQIGDRVCYRTTFCQLVEQSLSIARGHIIALKPLKDNSVALVEWENCKFPEEVLVSNLCKVGFNLDFSKN